MTALLLPRQLLEDTFGQLRRCGRGRAECAAYWCASLRRPEQLTRLAHPDHDAARGGYQVSSVWVTQFFLDLRQAGDTVRVQVHTHPHEAWHSLTDDHFSLAPAEGFLSLVIPDFAAGPASLAGAALARMRRDGSWADADPEEAFRVS